MLLWTTLAEGAFLSVNYEGATASTGGPVTVFETVLYVVPHRLVGCLGPVADGHSAGMESHQGVREIPSDANKTVTTIAELFAKFWLKVQHRCMRSKGSTDEVKGWKRRASLHCEESQETATSLPLATDVKSVVGLVDRTLKVSTRSAPD